MSNSSFTVHNGVGVPSGGTTNQVLTKSSNSDYATQWSNDSTPDADASTKGIVKLANDLSGTSALPTVVATHLAAALPVAQGGTGQTSYTDGQLLIGNSSGNTLTKATLIAGSNVTITNGNGSITIAATGGGGGTPGGSDTQVQFNDSSSFGGDSGLTYNKTTDTLTAGTLTLSNVLTSGNGGTGNGFTKFTGPTTSEKTFTLPNATATILTTNAAVTVAQGGTGAATLTGVVIGNGTSAFTTVTAPSGTIVGTSDTQTLTNKRITKRSGTTTSSATPTINTDNVDFYSLTALAAAITSFTTNLSGTPTVGQTLWIAITDDGTARAIAWGASFEASTVSLPTTTVVSTRLDVGFIWNDATTKWRCVAVA